VSFDLFDPGPSRVVVGRAPSLPQRAKNFAGAIVEVARSDKPVFELGEEATRRLEVCRTNACGQAKNTTLPFIGEVLFCQHIECGCFMGLKTKLSAMKCPMDLW
jgi:hypothetical protein